MGDPDRDDWQRGLCHTYATAMLNLYPHLRLGVLIDPESSIEMHYFVHDDAYAYDSLGRRELPFASWDGEPFEQVLDADPECFPVFIDQGHYERALSLIPRHHPSIPKEDHARPSNA